MFICVFFSVQKGSKTLELELQDKRFYTFEQEYLLIYSNHGNKELTVEIKRPKRIGI